MKERLVVFSGAGFSKALGLPLTSELWELGLVCTEEALKYGFEPDEIKKCAPFKESVRRGDKDVETLLNDWERHIEKNELHEETDSALASGRSYRDQYVTNLAMHLENLTLKGKAHPMAIQFARWIKSTVDRYDLSFITTNYDRCVEYILNSTGLTFAYMGKDAHVSIRKLHGSVNWMKFNGQVVREDRWKPVKIGELDGTGIFDFQLHDPAWFAAQLPPAIIPPTLNKRYEGVFQSQFEDAGKLIRNADRVMFVGYSFPPADKKLGEFLQGAIADSSCKNFFCVNDNPDAQKRAAEITTNRQLTQICQRWTTDHFLRFSS